MKLDLGCGQKPLEGYVGVDLPEEPLSIAREGSWQAHVDPRGIVRFDLASGIPWPFADESVEELFSSHVIEHLPAGRVMVCRWGEGSDGFRTLLPTTRTQDVLFWFLDEAWRITQPGGTFLLRWPALEDWKTKEIQLAAFQDPTHYRFIPLSQIQYWNRAGRKALGVEQYGARCDWVPVLVPVEGSDRERIEAPHILQRELVGGQFRVLETEVLLRKAS